VPMHNQGSIDLVEIYATKRCHKETDSDSTIISSPSVLRTNLLMMREGILGSYPNPLLRYFINV
jgi:hypothetical protein